MPTFPIVDAHVHLWDISNICYPWLEDEPILHKTFLLDDYTKACRDIQVKKIVFMQCECDPRQSMREVEWITDIASRESRIRGIIPHAPLERGHGVQRTLERLARNKLVKGVRRIIQSELNLEFCLQPGFIDGIQLLSQFHFSFDLGISYKNMPNANKLIERCPDVNFMLDHLGKPNIKGKELEPWRRGIMEMSQYPNVYCKISSLATEADHKNWVTDDLRPYAETVLECFGFDRVVFSSDWPVSSLAATIPVCVQTLESLLGVCRKGDLRKLFCLNAETFCRI